MSVVAGGEADVLWAECGAEWMGGGVDSAGIEVESDGGGDFFVECLLGYDWEVSFKFACWICEGFLYGEACGVDDLWAEGVENFSYV